MTWRSEWVTILLLNATLFALGSLAQLVRVVFFPLICHYD